MNKITLYFILLFSISITGQTTYNINNPLDLENNTYAAGDVIILANGTYSSSQRIDFIGNGTASDPITFRAETPGGVKFTGGLQMNIGGDYVFIGKGVLVQVILFNLETILIMLIIVQFKIA
jgi:poly(beta-D-mannuronate) lyase